MPISIFQEGLYVQRLVTREPTRPHKWESSKGRLSTAEWQQIWTMLAPGTKSDSVAPYIPKLAAQVALIDPKGYHERLGETQAKAWIRSLVENQMDESCRNSDIVAVTALDAHARILFGTPAGALHPTWSETDWPRILEVLWAMRASDGYRFANWARDWKIAASDSTPGFGLDEALTLDSKLWERLVQELEVHWHGGDWGKYVFLLANMMVLDRERLKTLPHANETAVESLLDRYTKQSQWTLATRLLIDMRIVAAGETGVEFEPFVSGPFASAVEAMPEFPNYKRP